MVESSAFLTNKNDYPRYKRVKNEALPRELVVLNISYVKQVKYRSANYLYSDCSELRFFNSYLTKTSKRFLGAKLKILSL